MTYQPFKKYQAEGRALGQERGGAAHLTWPSFAYVAAPSLRARWCALSKTAPLADLAWSHGDLNPQPPACKILEQVPREGD